MLEKTPENIIVSQENKPILEHINPEFSLEAQVTSLNYYAFIDQEQMQSSLLITEYCHLVGPKGALIADFLIK